MDRVTFKAGFTLLECVVVIVLCGFLAATSIRFYAGALRKTEAMRHRTSNATLLISTLESIEAHSREWLHTTSNPDSDSFRLYMESVMRATVSDAIRISFVPVQYRIDTESVTSSGTLFLITAWTDEMRLSRVIGF